MKKITILIIAITLLVAPAMALENIGHIGLGILYGPDNAYGSPNALQVVGVIKDSPAHNSIHINDYITHIDGTEVSKLGNEGAAAILNNGQSVNLTINRNDEIVNVSLAPTEITCSPDKVAESSRKIGKVVSVESREYFRSNLNEFDEIKAGDSFIIVDGQGNVVGKALANQVYGGDSFFRITDRNYELNTAKMDQYSLVYAGYRPMTSRHFSDKELAIIKDWNAKQAPKLAALKRSGSANDTPSWRKGFSSYRSGGGGAFSPAMFRPRGFKGACFKPASNGSNISSRYTRKLNKSYKPSSFKGHSFKASCINNRVRNSAGGGFHPQTYRPPVFNK